ncbi:MAG: hypothetical protein U1A24_05085 [Cypionkella sp.]|nr:hypothetical protein [Cypionkella sp.]MDZ4309917.1 hypothetical protein [Cypionkella sp.]MDZ4391380.1 hypothetical protein [Cypionkella sp.]
MTTYDLTDAGLDGFESDLLTVLQHFLRHNEALLRKSCDGFIL